MKSRQQWRRELRQTRRALSWRERRAAHRQIAQNLSRHPALRRARHISLYQAYASELDLENFAKRAQTRRKQLYLPKIAGHNMGFLPAQHQQRTNHLGISEPTHGRPRPPWALDVVLLPLLGLDRQGNRLGQGGGYYDRWLAKARFRRPVLLGVAYDCQIVDALPPEPWDIPLDGAVTPTQIFTFRI